MLPKTLFTTTLVAFVILSAILQVTSPSTIHPVGILFVYILMYVLALGLLAFFLVGVSSILQSLHLTKTHLPLTRSYYYASVLALAPVILLAINSIGRLGLYEVALIIIFEAVAIFYISRRY